MERATSHRVGRILMIIGFLSFAEPPSKRLTRLFIDGIVNYENVYPKG